MLKTGKSKVSLDLERDNCIKKIPNEAKKKLSNNSRSQINIKYPVTKYPLKPKSLNIVKEVSYYGRLVGVKGQYLIFDDETVFNIRSNEGLVLNLNIN